MPVTSLLSRKRSKRLTAAKMAGLHRSLHDELTATYWYHATNQQVCQRGIDELVSIHVSKKAEEAFVIAFVETIREVFSHASGNITEMSFTEEGKHNERKGYWKTLSKLFDKIIPRLMATESSSSVPLLSRTGRMAGCLAYASLFSVYKDVAREGNQIVTVRESARKIFESVNTSETTQIEAENLQQLYEAIDLIYILRHEIPKKHYLAPVPGTRRSIASSKHSSLEMPSVMDDEVRKTPAFVKSVSFEIPDDEDEEDGEEETIVEEFAGVLSEVIVEHALNDVEDMLMEERRRTIEVKEREKEEERRAALERRQVEIEEMEKEREDEMKRREAELSLKRLEAAQEMERRREEKDAISPVVDPIAFKPLTVSPAIEPGTSVFFELIHKTRSISENRNETEKEEEKMDSEAVQLSPFDPAKCFKEVDKVARYGRKSLFDDPLPVIVSAPRKPHMATVVVSVPEVHAPSAIPTPPPSLSSPSQQSTDSALLSPSYTSKLEDKIIRAVLGEKPVSPVNPPPEFEYDY